MSDVQISCDRNTKNGRFLSGCKPGPGRGVGSRNRLADSFIADLKLIWEAHGIAALEKCAVEQPEVLIKVVASLMPKTLDLNVAVDAGAFVEKFRTACQLLGNAEPPRLRRSLRNEPMKVINAR